MVLAPIRILDSQILIKELTMDVKSSSEVVSATPAAKPQSEQVDTKQHEHHNHTEQTQTEANVSVTVSISQEAQQKANAAAQSEDAENNKDDNQQSQSQAKQNNTTVNDEATAVLKNLE